MIKIYKCKHFIKKYNKIICFCEYIVSEPKQLEQKKIHNNVFLNVFILVIKYSLKHYQY